ncbi:MAG: BBE domain-containing protein, partial [Streptosporangiales bacterium]
VKARWDPRNVFNHQQSITPAVSEHGAPVPRRP